ncbi:MAG: hypothetical protein ACYTKD_15515 [Planctomycetota bacterium]|jgi:hypothetical protein
MAPEDRHEGGSEREREGERDRVERLVREGNVSAEEGRKLVDAIDDAERREASAAVTGESAKESSETSASPAGGPNRHGIFSRPLALFLAGLAVSILGHLVFSLIVGDAMESLPRFKEGLDAGSLSDKLGEVSDQLGRAWFWSAPLFLIGFVLIVVSIFKFIVRMAVREARKV